MGPGGGRGGDWKNKTNKGLAWFAFALAVAAGSALTGTFVGSWISGIVGFLPNWVTVPMMFGAFLWMAGDLFADGIPNKPALYISMVLPSMAVGMSGKLADSVQSWARQVLDRIDGSLGEWVGTGSVLTLAATVVVASLVIARRTVNAR